jgi:uroporphyrinogen III methyltransferase/synthase
MSQPLVYLIGAGPGDPGLITVRGLECIASADVVVYDFLPNARFLSEASPDAELVYVGRRDAEGGPTPVDIGRLLVARATEGGGRIVARLKEGDPFVFGGGGDEALALAEGGVDFELVPGVSAAIATPAYAGIPPTKRGIACDVTFVVGDGGPCHIDDGKWAQLGAGDGTLVFFVGVDGPAEAAARLVENGRSPETPAAYVSRGTTPRQRTVTGTLADIGELAEEAGADPSAMLIAGQVVRLRDTLAWFERKPLFGRTVVITRQRAQAAALVDPLVALGAEVLEYPTIQTCDPEDWVPLDNAIERMASYDWVILSSANAVERFFDRLAAHHLDARVLAHAQVAAVGTATAGRCIDRGVYPDFVPEYFRAEGLLDGLVERGVQAGDRILIPRALEAREMLPDSLRRAGAEVDVVPVYRTVLGAGEAGVLERIEEGTVDLIVFTAGSTVRNFVQLASGLDLDATFEQVAAASIGPVTTNTAQELGIAVTIEPAASTIPALVAEIREHFA